MPVSGPWEASYNGLDIGGDSIYALVPGIQGLGMPDVRTSDRARLRRHGLLPGDDFLAGRGLLFEVEIDAPTDDALNTAIADLATAFAPGQAEAVFTFQIPGVAGGGVRRILARPRKCGAQQDLDWYYGLPRVPILLEASDPRIYDDAQQQLVESLPTAGGGLTWPLSWPLSWGTPATGGTIIATNRGNFPAPVTLRIDGPATNPSVINVTQDVRLELALTLGAGEWVELDSDARTVLLGGTASRYSSLVEAGWFDLLPGDNELQFRATTPSAATLTVTWRSAWWM